MIGVMQGRDDPQADLWDVGSVAGHLLPEGGVFSFLAEHRSDLFPDAMFEDLFGSRRGRPSIPGPVIASVLVLQTLHNLSDRETAEAVRFDLRWKAACGFALDAPGFHPSVLTYWRRRLAVSDRPGRVFDAVTQVVEATGVVRGKKRRALDSTILDDAVARQDTVTQLIAQIRGVGKVVPGAADLITERCGRLTALTGTGYDAPGKPAIAWDDEQARDDLVSALVGDATALLNGLDLAAIEKAGGPAADAVALLGLVAGQDVEPAEGSDGTDGRWRIARKVAGDRVISTVDPETRHAHKTRHRRQDGFRAHVVVEPDTGLATVAELTKVSGPENSDATVGTRLLLADPTIDSGGNGPVQVLADSAYGTGDTLAALDAAGHEPVIKPWPLRSPTPGGFTIDDFTHDPQAGTVTCPNGVVKTITSRRRAEFGAACNGCLLRERCTTAKNGRVIVLHEHDLLQRAHRRRATSQDFQTVYRQHRPMVERTIAWLTRGARRVPYRGITKNDTWWRTRVAAINLRRLLALGLDHQDGAWTLA